MTAVNYKTVDVDGLNVFYRDAGVRGAPKLLLLHGFPSAGHRFRDLIPLLADHCDLDHATSELLGDELGKRRARAAVTVHELAKSARSDVLAANEAKPVDELRVGQAARLAFRRAHVVRPMRVSAPLMRREMFSLCFHHSSAAISVRTSASRPWPKAKSARGET